MTMLKMTSTPRKLFPGLIWLAGLLLCAGGQLHGQAAAPSALPPGDGKDLVAVACTQCHVLRPILILRDGSAGWKRAVQEMILRGAQLQPQEADTVIQYLAKNFGPGSSPMQSGITVSLPAGAGKELVESRCTLCHDLGRVATSKRSKVEWEGTVKDMVERGPAASPEQMQSIISYLTAQFGKEAD